MSENKKLSVNGKEYEIISLLGKGKGGYSYLAKRNGEFFVLKQIHHEPCSYYSFGNKIQAEINDYKRLTDAGIKIPLMYDVDVQGERIIKEYIEGSTIFELVKNNKNVDLYIHQLTEMGEKLKRRNLNIDYFPTNFIVQNELLYYIDYECNEYSDEWNFENWGKKYWSKTPEFEEYLKNHS